jgi:hypothetical protein
MLKTRKHRIQDNREDIMRKAVTGTNKECQGAHHKSSFKHTKWPWMWTTIQVIMGF